MNSWKSAFNSVTDGEAKIVDISTRHKSHTLNALHLHSYKRLFRCSCERRFFTRSNFAYSFVEMILRRFIDGVERFPVDL